jgi:hypothetical protein
MQGEPDRPPGAEIAHATRSATFASSNDDGSYQVRGCVDGDEDAVVALHERAFGRPWLRESWRWRTASGRGSAIGAFARDGACAAVFAGVPLRSRYCGVEALAISGSNSVLDPGLRRSLAGGRLFRRVVLQYFATFGGGHARMMYGAPASPLIRAMASTMRVEVLSGVDCLVRDAADDGERAPDDGSLQLALEPTPPAGVAALWDRCEGADTGLVRDHDFLEWRFCRHPTVAYRIVSARGRAGELRGVMVLRDGGWRDDLLSLCEWIVPVADEAAAGALLAFARDDARRRGSGYLAAVFSGNAPEYRGWQRRHRFCVHPTAHQMMFRSFAHEVDRSFLFDRWRITIGDLEFL